MARGQSQESILNVRVTSPDGKPFAMSPQISPQNKKIIPLRNGQDSGKKLLLLQFIYCRTLKLKVRYLNIDISLLVYLI